MPGRRICWRRGVKRSLQEQLSFLDGLWDENCPDADDHVEATEDGGVLLNYPTVHITTHMDPTWKENRRMIPRLKCFSVKDVDVSGESKNERVVTSLVEGEPSRELLAGGSRRNMPPERVSYSWRREFVGSSLAARRAGM